MTQSDTMRRRRLRCSLKVIGVLFIVLVLMRSDWLTAVFLFNTHPQEKGKGINSLPIDKTPYHGQGNGIINIEGKQKSIVRQMMNDKVPNQIQECPIPHLKNSTSFDDPYIATCKRSQPSKSSCDIAKNLFGDPLKVDIANACKKRTDQTYCKIKGSPSKWKARCDLTSCNTTWLLGIIDPLSGVLIETVHKSVMQLQKSIELIIKDRNIGFCFIECGLKEGKKKLSPVTQILNLPPYVKSHASVPRQDYININIIFIDSVSRHHFYRSLPRSVSTLDTLSTRSDVLVLDFEKVQGVRSRTYETLQTLFSADINPFEIPFGTQEMPTKKLAVQEIFNPLRGLGYTTLWLEDLCPYWEWGLSKDLLVYNSSLSKFELHKKFLSAIEQAGIDSVGNTFSSCKILQANGVNDPFHGPRKSCYNGHHQHEYLLDYLKMYAHEKLHKHQPYISFFETNVGHEGSGRRIQYFDTAFQDYMKYISKMHNTLTVIFSDHGNAYGDFVKAGNEGRHEMFHPFLFMIIPKNVQSYFTSRQLQSLRANQYKLISVLDLHYTFTYITEKLYNMNRNSMHESQDTFSSQVSDFNQQFNVSKYGLLVDISWSRTCSHIPRVMPNLCICEGYDVAVSGNLLYHEILAMYFIGTLNNEILKQRQAFSDPTSKQSMAIGGFDRCKKFMMDKVKNIRESKLNDHEMMAKMDLYVRTPGQNSAEIFFISVHVKHGSTISLGSFERITPYSQYSVCADKNVETKLCVCDKDVKDGLSKENGNKEDQSDIFESDNYIDIQDLHYSSMENEIGSVMINGNECLYIITHSNKYGIVFEAFNNCKETLKLIIVLNPVHMFMSTESTFKVTLLPMDIKFLSAGLNVSGGESSCTLQVKHS